MIKHLIFCLIDVSGSMKNAYSKNSSNSKIESLYNTIRNIIFSEYLFGWEQDIDFYALMFGTTFKQKWLNILEIYNILDKIMIKINEEDYDINKINFDKKYEIDNPKKELKYLLEKEGAIEIDRFINLFLSEEYLNILVYYLRINYDLLRKIYNELPDCHKKEDGLFFGIMNGAKRTAISFYNPEEEVKKVYNDVLKEIKNIIKDEIIRKIKDEYLNNSVELIKITGNSIFNLRKQLSSFLIFIFKFKKRLY